jgi:hypothetical protein
MADDASILFDLLGKNVMAPEAAKELERYPALQPEKDEAAFDEGEDPVHYLRSERDGLLIKLSGEGEILAIFLMSQGREGFSQFLGTLPGGLTFASTAADTLKALGAPAHSRPRSKLGSLQLGESLRFDDRARSLHFQFRSDGSGIEMLSALIAGTVPGRAVS